MKLTCEIVQDLLPLYEDNVCSPGSRAAVEEHLQECESCRTRREQARGLPEVEPEVKEAAAMEKKKLSRVSRELWFRGLMTWVAIFALVILIFNQCYGVGVCFTNWDELLLAKRFAGYLEKGEYQKAAELFDYHYSYDICLEALERPQEFYRYDFSPVELDGESWYMKSPLLDNFEEPYDSAEIWEWMLFTQHGGMIPMEVWLEYTTREGVKVKGNGGGYIITEGLDSEVFYELTTSWGVYMVDEYSYDRITRSDGTLRDYGTTFLLMPEELYRLAEPELEALAQEKYAQVQRENAWVVELTPEEFEILQRQAYAERLEAFFAQGYTLTEGAVTGLQYAGYQGGAGWTVFIRSRVEFQGESYPLELMVHVQNGQVAILNYAFDNPPAWAMDFYEALQMIPHSEGRLRAAFQCAPKPPN